MGWVGVGAIGPGRAEGYPLVAVDDWVVVAGEDVLVDDGLKEV